MLFHLASGDANIVTAIESDITVIVMGVIAALSLSQKFQRRVINNIPPITAPLKISINMIW